MRIYEDIVKNVSNLGKNDFFLVVVEKNKLDIIYQRELRFQKIVNYFRNSIVIEKIFLLFFWMLNARGDKTNNLFFLYSNGSNKWLSPNFTST